MFPSASITGAPKARTMEIIAALEDRPRGIYTGTVGYVAPNGDASSTWRSDGARRHGPRVADIRRRQRNGLGLQCGGGIRRVPAEGQRRAAAPPDFELLETLALA